MLFATRYGAPARLRGGLRVIRRTEWMRPSAAAVTASSPSSAPLGTMICPPRALASSIRSGRGSSAPAESTITCFPASNIGRQIRSSIGAGVHSIARSACAGNASGSTKAHAIRSLASQACTLTWSRAAAQASVNPGMPAESLRTSTRPMAPRPATATRVVELTGFGTKRPPRSLLLRGPLPDHKQV
jgi:hypothetical protein